MYCPRLVSLVLLPVSTGSVRLEMFDGTEAPVTG